MRVFNAQIDTLQKLRGKGQQKITVEHVNVKEIPDEELLRIILRGSEGIVSEEVSQNDGGQAIVDVTNKGGGK